MDNNRELMNKEEIKANRSTRISGLFLGLNICLVIGIIVQVYFLVKSLLG